MRSAVRQSEEGARRRRSKYELELGSKSLLGLFFAFAVICGMFFAFGYTFGKHAVPANFQLGSSPQAQLPEPAPASTTPGVQPPNPAELGQAENNQTPAALAPDAGATTDAQNSAASAAAPSDAAPAPDASDAQPAAVPPATAASAGQNVFHVQVFAGIKADADSLAQALRQRGYPVKVVPPNPGETDLYRVQVGPYLTVDEAKAMRSRLTADGYQAILK